MITTLFAGLLGLLYVRISFDVIKARRSQKISLGVGPEGQISALVSAHSNFSSYAVYLLLLLYLLEQSKIIPSVVLYFLATAFTVGRLLHYLAFKSSQMNFKLRVRGMMLTLFPLTVLSLLNVFCYVKLTFFTL